jgi:transcriptional regulator with XRE-family HTH domain
VSVRSDKPDGERRGDLPRLGGRVRAARERLGWSREALAYRAGLSWSAVEQIESGRRRNARPDTLEALSRALAVTIDYLVHGGQPPTMLIHQVLVYRDDDSFLAAAGPFLAEGAERSEALLAVTTARNIAALREWLGKGADQVAFAEAAIWYGSPASAMNAYRAFLDESQVQRSGWMRIVGEPVWAGRSQEEIREWNQYESLVNLAFGSLPVSVLCPYDERSVDPDIVETARLTHPRILEGREVVDNPSYQDPGEFVLGSTGARGSDSDSSHS